jgi:hypothetical protein
MLTPDQPDDVVPQPSNPGQLARSQENAARLRECAGPHVFVQEVAVVETEDKIGKIVPTGLIRCRTCQGRVTAEQARWYKHGYQHGRAGLEAKQQPARAVAPHCPDDGLHGKRGIR